MDAKFSYSICSFVYVYCSRNVYRFIFVVQARRPKMKQKYLFILKKKKCLQKLQLDISNQSIINWP